MENTLISHELEEMRSQISILKEKLDKQTIINEGHIRRSMKTKISDINRVIRTTIFLGVFAVIFSPTALYFQGCSLLFVSATALMLAVCLALTIVQKVRLGRIDVSQGNLIDTAERLGMIRAHYKDWYKIAVPMILVWLGWMIYELVGILGFESPYAIGLYCGVMIGGLIGGIIGMRINVKVVRQATEILAQVEELKKTA